jgi:hypothetical protein
MLGLSVVVITLLIAWMWSGKSYPEASSSEGLQLIKALYTACSSKSDERLARVEERLAAIGSQGKLTEEERIAFSSIISDARTGNWGRAATDCYQFAQDQVR